MSKRGLLSVGVFAPAIYLSLIAAGGLLFPATQSPEPWDFLYFSFGIGMTAQVSDVQVTTMALRRLVTLHAVGSYFYNAVILALAVNAALSLAG